MQPILLCRIFQQLRQNTYTIIHPEVTKPMSLRIMFLRNQALQLTVFVPVAVLLELGRLCFFPDRSPVALIDALILTDIKSLSRLDFVLNPELKNELHACFLFCFNSSHPSQEKHNHRMMFEDLAKLFGWRLGSALEGVKIIPVKARSPPLAKYPSRQDYILWTTLPKHPCFSSLVQEPARFQHIPTNLNSKYSEIPPFHSMLYKSSGGTPPPVTRAGRLSCPASVAETGGRLTLSGGTSPSNPQWTADSVGR